MVAQVLARARREQQQWHERRTQRPWKHHQGLNREDDQEVKAKNTDEGQFVSWMLNTLCKTKLGSKKYAKKIPLSWRLKEAKHTLQHQVPFPAQHYLWNTQLGTQSMTTSIEHNSSWIQCIATISTVRSETTNWHKNPSVSCQPHRFNTWQQQRGKDKEKKTIRNIDLGSLWWSFLEIGLPKSNKNNNYSEQG